MESQTDVQGFPDSISSTPLLPPFLLIISILNSNSIFPVVQANWAKSLLIPLLSYPISDLPANIVSFAFKYTQIPVTFQTCSTATTLIYATIISFQSYCYGLTGFLIITSVCLHQLKPKLDHVTFLLKILPITPISLRIKAKPQEAVHGLVSSLYLFGHTYYSSLLYYIATLPFYYGNIPSILLL